MKYIKPIFENGGLDFYQDVMDILIDLRDESTPFIEIKETKAIIKKSPNQTPYLDSINSSRGNCSCIFIRTDKLSLQDANIDVWSKPMVRPDGFPVNIENIRNHIIQVHDFSIKIIDALNRISKINENVMVYNQSNGGEIMFVIVFL